MIRIGIVLFDGFDELDGLAPFEVLKNAAAEGAPFDVHLFTIDGASRVRASHGLEIVVPAAALTFDWVLVPGGGWASRGGSGAWAEIQRGALPAWLKAARDRGTALASICTGAMILSAAGVTRGRPATTHGVARQALAAEGALLVDARVVDDGDLVTAGGVTSGIDLALWLTERLASPVIAAAVATEMEHAPSRQIHRRAA